MGIDIYTQWKGATDREQQEQFAAWLSVTAGKRGYLREAYHGSPYATKFLCKEAFQVGGADVPARVLRERLPLTLKLVEERMQDIYQATEEDVEAMQQNYRDFVEFCERKEQETGEPLHLVADY